MNKINKWKQWKKNSDEILQLFYDGEIKITQITDYHVRINGRYDVWPTRKKFYDMKTKKYGVYESAREFIES